MLVLDLLDGAEAVARHPVLGDLIIDQTRSLLARLHTTLLSELLPLSLGLLDWDWFLPGDGDGGGWHVDCPLGSIVLEDLSVGTKLSILLLLHVKELLVHGTDVGCRPLGKLLGCDVCI